jgi:putative transcription factor
MQCEMCGKAVATRRYMVEGTVMSLGIECSKYGTPLDTPAPVGTQAAMQQGLEKRASRMVSRNVYDSADERVLVEDYGSRVHKAREAKGWTHDVLGNKVHARVPELRQIEAGKMRPSDDVSRRLEKALGITLYEAAEGPAAVVSGVNKAPAGGSAGLTIGDLLKDAMDRKDAKGTAGKAAAPAGKAGKKA